MNVAVLQPLAGLKNNKNGTFGFKNKQKRGDVRRRNEMSRSQTHLNLFSLKAILPKQGDSIALFLHSALIISYYVL